MAELTDKFGPIKTELIEGANGVFDVEVDGQLVYSKHKTGTFPRYREIIDLIEQKRVDG